jgi:hypothetical protein
MAFRAISVNSFSGHIAGRLVTMMVWDGNNAPAAADF